MRHAAHRPEAQVEAFTRTPYADAMRRARLQDRIVRGVLAGLVLLLLLVLLWLVLR